MRKMLFFYLFIMALLGSCAHDSISNQNKDYDQFLINLRNKRDSLPRDEYQVFLKRTLNQKEEELDGLIGQLKYKERNYQFNESTEHESVNPTLPNTQSLGREIDMKRTDHRIQLVKSQIFHLKSLLSNLSSEQEALQ